MILMISVTHSHTIFSGRLHFRMISFCSAAEGFVFLSGITAGLVYFSRLRRGRSAFDGLWARLGKLYTYHLGIVGVTILLTSLWLVSGAHIDHLPWDWMKRFYAEPAQSSLPIALLLDQPPYLDILPLYLGTSLLLPFVLILLEARGYRPVLVLSVSAWLAAQLGVEPAKLASDSVGMPGRHGFALLLAWQLLFVLGVLCAYAHQEKRFNFESPSLTRLCMFVAVICCMAEMVCVVTRFHNPPFTNLLYLHALLDVKQLGLLRLLNFLALAQLGFRFRHLWVGRARKLIPIGKHSLQTFSLSVVLVHLLAVLQVASAREQMSPVGLALFDTFSVGLILFLIWVTALWMEEADGSRVHKN